MAECLIGIGANLGDPRHQLDGVRQCLTEHTAIRLVSMSAPWQSPPVGGPAGQPLYLNAAAILETDLSPQQLLIELQGIERLLGRRPAARWDARLIDLDILLYGAALVQQPQLQIPHPWMVVRSFVLGPAAEIAPQWQHPRLGWSIGRLWEHLQRVPPRFACTMADAGQSLQAVADQLGAVRVADPRDETPFTTVPSLAHQLELLAQRAVRLQQGGWNRPAPVGTLSEFWLDESLLRAEATLALHDLRRFELRFRELESQFEPPKLVIVVRSSPADDKQESTTDDSWTGRLLDHIVRRNRSPFVEVVSSPHADFVREVTGAVLGMQVAARRLSS